MKDFGTQIAMLGRAPADATPDIEAMINSALDPAYDSPMNPAAGMGPSLDFMNMQPSYAAGGMVGPGGMPVGQGAGLQLQSAGPGGLTPELMQREIKRIAQQRPQEVLAISDAVMTAIQSGELTPEELNQIAQLTLATVQNPEVYPQVRQFAIEQGLATEQELPPQYDEGLVFILMMVVQMAQQNMGGQDMMAGGGAAPMPGQPQSANQPPIGSFSDGGELPDKSPNADGSMKINAHEGETVLTKAATEYWGSKHIQRMEKEAQEAMGGNGQDYS